MLFNWFVYIPAYNYLKYLDYKYYYNKLKNEHLLQDNKKDKVCKFNNSEFCNCKCSNLNPTDNGE